MPAMSQYRRTLGVSVDRIWENALDWEHLPHLHGSTFSRIELLERSASPELWRARVGMVGIMATQVVIELRTDRPRSSYVTRTLDGIGRGTEVHTRLAPRGERSTDIEVEFLLAGVPRLLMPVAAAGYKRLYHRLWTEDEAMMTHRQRVLDAATARRALRDAPRSSQPSGVAHPPQLDLGPVAALRQRVPLRVDTPRGEVRVVTIGDELVAHVTTCPHLGGPLGDAPIIDGCITCPWHGYRFDVRTGRAVGAHRCKLPQPARVQVDPVTRRAQLVWAPPRTSAAEATSGDPPGDPDGDPDLRP